MIDTRTESLLTLVQLSELVRKHVTTVYRWTTTGCRGVTLETLQIGGTRFTSHEALQRFSASLTCGRGAPKSPSGAKSAAQELARYGV